MYLLSIIENTGKNIKRIILEGFLYNFIDHSVPYRLNVTAIKFVK